MSTSIPTISDISSHSSIHVDWFCLTSFAHVVFYHFRKSRENFSGWIGIGGIPVVADLEKSKIVGLVKTGVRR